MREWVEKIADAGPGSSDAAAIGGQVEVPSNILAEMGAVDTADAARQLLAATTNLTWTEDRHTSERLRPILQWFGRHYLARAKHAASGGPLCDVGRFHTRNGASLRRLNWQADVSEQGRQRSLCLMANYHYEPTRLKERAIQWPQLHIHQDFESLTGGPQPKQ